MKITLILGFGVISLKSESFNLDKSIDSLSDRSSEFLNTNAYSGVEFGDRNDELTNIRKLPGTLVYQTYHNVCVFKPGKITCYFENARDGGKYLH